jgi:putative transposase
VDWSLSNTMTADWCADTLQTSFRIYGCPEIINSDKGSQFTSDTYIRLLKGKSIKISMDSRDKAQDNIYIERLWRSVKQENITIKKINLHRWKQKLN